jgi:hypothetical protein
LRVLSHERELNYAIDFETRGDSPLLGDYNGDGEIDLAIRHSGERAWYIKFGGERGVERAVSDLEVRIPERRLRN